MEREHHPCSAGERTDERPEQKRWGNDQTDQRGSARRFERRGSDIVAGKDAKRGDWESDAARNLGGTIGTVTDKDRRGLDEARGVLRAPGDDGPTDVRGKKELVRV